MQSGVCRNPLLGVARRKNESVVSAFSDMWVPEQIAADSIEIVRREKVVGYEMSLMSQDELMELLGMTKVREIVSSDACYLALPCPVYCADVCL